VLPGVAQDDEIVTCDLEELLDGQVLRRMHRQFGMDVLFENDVNGAVFGHAFAQDEGVCAGVYFPKNYCPGAGVVVDGEILYGKGHFAGEVSYMDAEDAWLSLDYEDESAAAEKISRLLVVYACTVAPAKMVLYGDFFTPEMERRICENFALRMRGRFSMEISFRKTMTQDMELGAKKLGLRRMFELLSMQD